MAVRYRNRRRAPSNAAPISFSVTSNDPLAEQAKRWNAELTLANATEALHKLGDGHSDEFMALANQLYKTATDTADKEYWRQLIDHTKQKLAEDTLVAEVTAGTKTLEDYKAYLNDQIKAEGPQGGRYPDLIKQLGDVTNAVYARDFNSEINQAQQRLIESGDRKAYLKDLSNLVSRSRSAEASAALGDRIATVRTDIQKEQVTQRASEANVQMIRYVEGKIGKGEIQTVLEGMAAAASTPEEAARYTTLVTQIDTRERTLARQGLSDAASAGSKAVEEALAPYKTSYGDADTSLVTALRTTADKGAYATFQTEAKDYAEALRNALPHATSASARTTLNNTLNAVLKNIAERDKQMAAAVVNDVKVNVADLRAKANAATDPDIAAQFRYLATKALQAALVDPILANNDDQKQQLQTVLGSVAGDHQAEIRKTAAEVDTNTPGGTKYAAAITTLMNNYRDWTVGAGKNAIKSVGGGLFGSGAKPASVVSDLATFDQLMHEGTTADDIAPIVEALGLDPSNEAALAKVASLIENYRQVTAPLEQNRTKASTTLETLMAPRDANGIAVDTSPAALARKGYAGGGRIVPGYNAPGAPAGAFGKPAPAPDASTVPADQAAVDPRLAAFMQPPPAETPQAPAGPDTATLDALATLHGDGGARDPFTLAEDRAFSWLEQTATLELPNYDLPDLPDIPDFTPKVRDTPPIDLSPAGQRSADKFAMISPSPAASSDSGSGPMIAA